MTKSSLKNEMRGRRKSAGFTVVELIYVLVIMLIIGGMALPRINLGRVRVGSSSMKVASYLLVAQRMAVTRQHNVRVSFDEIGGTVQIHEDANNNGLIEGTERLRTETLDEGVSFSVSGAPLFGGGEALTFAPDANALPSVIFRRNGSASEEGAVHVTALPTGRPEYDRAIRVNRATGLARCWSRETGTWTEGC
jgi:Tfp pilus assembly protein FimT